MHALTLGVDIGGTHITAAVVDLTTRTVLLETINRQPVDANGSIDTILLSWGNAIRAAMGKAEGDVKHIGVAMPGPFDYESGIALMQNQDKYDALYGIDVKELLAQSLNVDKQNFRFQNDAPCFLQGEVFAGAARDYNRAIGLTLGTGLGSTVFVNGKAWDANLWDTPFLSGIAEEHLSSRWFVKRFHELSGKRVANVKSIVDLIPSEPKVQVLFSEFAENLAVFLGDFVRKEQPEVVVLGGNIAKSYSLFGSTLQMKLQEQKISVPVREAQLGEMAALLGAASLWQE